MWYGIVYPVWRHYSQYLMIYHNLCNINIIVGVHAKSRIYIHVHVQCVYIMQVHTRFCMDTSDILDAFGYHSYVCFSPPMLQKLYVTFKIYNIVHSTCTNFWKVEGIRGCLKKIIFDHVRSGYRFFNGYGCKETKVFPLMYKFKHMLCLITN